jgi:hypothetical protein
MVVTIDVVPEAWFGVGPAISWLRSSDGAPGEPGSSGDVASQVGLLLEAGLVTSKQTPWFGTLIASYHLVPKQREGPYPKLVPSGEFIAPLDVSYGRVVIAAGAGVRFRLP